MSDSYLKKEFKERDVQRPGTIKPINITKKEIFGRSLVRLGLLKTVLSKILLS